MKKRILGNRDHLSINFIGVLPAERRQGAGSALVRYVTKKADEAHLPVFAEVWGQSHLNWFLKFDFQVEAEKNLSDKDNVCIYYVLREPKLDPTTPTVFSPEETMAALHLEPPREDALAALQNGE